MRKIKLFYLFSLHIFLQKCFVRSFVRSAAATNGRRQLQEERRRAAFLKRAFSCNNNLLWLHVPPFLLLLFFFQSALASSKSQCPLVAQHSIAGWFSTQQVVDCRSPSSLPPSLRFLCAGNQQNRSLSFLLCLPHASLSLFLNIVFHHGQWQCSKQNALSCTQLVCYFRIIVDAKYCQAMFVQLYKINVTWWCYCVDQCGYFFLDPRVLHEFALFIKSTG